MSVLETGLLPDGIANPAEVAALEGPADSLVDGERGRPAPPQQLVRRDHLPRRRAPLVVVIRLLRPPTPGAAVAAAGAVAEYLGPVRYVHRQRGGGGAISSLVATLLARRGGHRLGQLGAARLDGASPDVGLVELVGVCSGGGDGGR